MAITFLKDIFPLSPYHSISLGLLQSWTSELKDLLIHARKELDNEVLIDQADPKECIALKRTRILFDEWLDKPCSLHPDDRALLDQDSLLKNVLYDIESQTDKFTRYHYRDSYLLMTGVSRKISKLTYTDEVDSTEISAYILSRMYNPLNIDLSIVSSQIDYKRVFNECYASIADISIYKITRFFRIYYYYVEHGIPMPPLTLIHCAGCVLLSLYRLSGLFRRTHSECVYNHLMDIFAHLTIGVPHGHQEESTSNLTFPGLSFLTEKCRRDHRPSTESLKINLYPS